MMVSTPTAAALEIRRPWDEAIHGVESSEKYILNVFANILAEKKNNILETERILSGILADIFERFRRARENLKNNLVKIKMTIDYDKNYLSNASKKLVSNYIRLFSEFKNILKSLAEKIILHNPERQLKLGYSLVSFNNKIVRSVKDVQIGDEVDIKMSDGELKSKIFKVEQLKETQKIMKKETNLTQSLKKLEEIVEWFESQQEVDVEKGLEKVKEGAALIKASKERLKKVENEFEEVKKELEEEVE